MSLKKTCPICADEFGVIRFVKCPYCPFEACKNCCQTYLLASPSDIPICMEPSCKAQWSLDFLADNFPKKFHNDQYREKRATLLFEREKSLMPGTQELAMREKKRRDMEKFYGDQQQVLREEIRILENSLRIKKEQLNFLRFPIYQNEEKEEKEENEEKEEKRQFIRGCSVPDCRGFLSTGLKCGTCGVKACGKCYEPIVDAEEHKCDEGLVETMKFIKRDTKPCPGCGERIHKIDGCDQMYCTTCHTAFSWKHGRIETGVIHNPHFYEFQRNVNGGNAPTRQIALGCGGLADIRHIRPVLRSNGVDEDGVRKFQNIHRLVNHIRHIELHRYRIFVGDMDNSTLRVKYLLKDFDETRLQLELKKKMKKQEKNRDINEILTMFTQTLVDTFRNIVEGKEPEFIQTQINTFEELKTYVNNAFDKIRSKYAGVAPYISDKWLFFSSRRVFENTAIHNY